MNASTIAGLVVFTFPALVIAAGLASGNVFVNLDVDTNRRSAPVTFWAVTGMWALIASFGLIVVFVNWNK